MTRRDYCAECDELVGDCDVMCHKCCVSLCSECATKYDSRSSILLFIAKVRVYGRLDISVDEVHKFIEHFQSDEIISELKKQNPCFDNYKRKNLDELIQIYDGPLSSKGINDDYNMRMLEDYEMDLKDLLKFADSIKNKYDDESSLLGLDDEKRLCWIIDFLDLTDYLEFECYMCHKGIEVTY